MKPEQPSPQTTAELDWTATDQEAWRLAEIRKSCDHSTYKDFATHGRCCPACGFFMVDFGD